MLNSSLTITSLRGALKGDAAISVRVWNLHLVDGIHQGAEIASEKAPRNDVVVGVIK